MAPTHAHTRCAQQQFAAVRLFAHADHGCHDIEVKDDDGKKRISGTHGSPSKEDVTIPWIAFGAGVKPHYTITAPVVQYDTAATALWLLGVPLPEHFWGRPVVSAFQ